MKKIQIYFFLCLFSIYSYAQLTKTPFITSFKNLESSYTVKTIDDRQFYIVETLQYITAQKYNNGILYFLPKLLTIFDISLSSPVIEIYPDMYIGSIKSSLFNFSKYNKAYDCFQPNKVPYGYECILKMLNEEDIIFFSPSPSIKIKTPNKEIFSHLNNLQNRWLYFYPKTKKDFINKGTNLLYQYKKPIGTSFTFLFDKEKIDAFILNHPNKIKPYQENCFNTLTYFQNFQFDRLIKKIKSVIQEHNLPVKKASDFQSFDEIETYFNELNATLHNESDTNVQFTLDSLYYLLEGTKTRKETTKNLCLYLNYITNTPEYKALREVTIINSQGKPGSLEDLYKFFKNINGYVIDGKFIKYDNKSYFIDNSNNFYDITHGCKIVDTNKVTSSELKNVLSSALQNQPNPEYLILMDDWDNDTNETTDCLKYTPSTNTLAKAKMDNGVLTFIDLDPSRIGHIEYSNNIIYFNRNFSYSSSSESFSYSSTSSINNESSSFSTFSSSSSSGLDFPGGSGSGGFFENPNPIPITSSSSSEVSSSSAQSSSSNSFVNCTSSISNEVNSTIQEIVNKLKNRELDITGYFAYYGDSNNYDPYAWVYFSKSGNIFAKLNGMDPNTGKLKWIFLKRASKNINYFQDIHLQNDKIVIGNSCIPNT